MNRASYLPIFRIIYSLLIVLLSVHKIGTWMDKPETKIVALDEKIELNTKADTLIAVSLVPVKDTDWIWWTSDDPSRVTVWPLGLEAGKFPERGSASIISRAKIGRGSNGSAQICAELHRAYDRGDVIISRDCTTVKNEG